MRVIGYIWCYVAHRKLLTLTGRLGGSREAYGRFELEPRGRIRRPRAGLQRRTLQFESYRRVPRGIVGIRRGATCTNLG